MVVLDDMFIDLCISMDFDVMEIYGCNYCFYYFFSVLSLLSLWVFGFLIACMKLFG